MVEWTFLFIHIYFLFGKKFPTSPYMRVRGSLVNNIFCSKTIYVSVLSQLSNVGQEVSHFLKEGPLQGQDAHKTMNQTRLGMTREGQDGGRLGGMGPTLGGCSLPCRTAGSVLPDLHKSPNMDLLCEISQFSNVGLIFFFLVPRPGIECGSESIKS